MLRGLAVDWSAGASVRLMLACEKRRMASRRDGGTEEEGEGEGEGVRGGRGVQGRRPDSCVSRPLAGLKTADIQAREVRGFAMLARGETGRRRGGRELGEKEKEQELGGESSCPHSFSSKLLFSLTSSSLSLAYDRLLQGEYGFCQVQAQNRDLVLTQILVPFLPSQSTLSSLVKLHSRPSPFSLPSTSPSASLPPAPSSTKSRTRPSQDG